MSLIELFINDITNIRTVCIYFTLGIVVAVILENPIQKSGITMNYLDRLWVVLGWPLWLIIFILTTFSE
jgi:hypothetical protein